MDARPSHPETQGLLGHGDLQRGAFQTPEERAQLRAAVYQVFGGQPWEGCCAHRLLKDFSRGQRSSPEQQAIGATMDSSFSGWGTRGQRAQPLELEFRWGSGALGPSPLPPEEASEVLAALERKHRALQRKLCGEMLRGHLGHQLWTSLADHTKEEKLLEMMALVELALPHGSLLPLSSLPGAGHQISSGVGSGVGQFCHSAAGPTGGEALRHLRQKKQGELAALLAQPRLLESRDPDFWRQLFRLHAEAELVEKEATLRGALLALELLTGERFWDSQPSAPEASHRQLAELRLAAHRKAGLAGQPQARMVPRRPTKVVLDQLLLHQERDRSSLITSLMVPVEPKAAQGPAPPGAEPAHLGEGRHGAEASLGAQEPTSLAPSLAQEPLPTEAGPGPSWWDGAVSRLVALQQEQQEELRWTIEKLAEAPGRRETLVMDRKAFSPQRETPDSRASSMKSMLQRTFSEASQEVNKCGVQKHFWTSWERFPLQEELESQQEGPGLSPQSRLDEPGLQQRTNIRGEDLRFQDTVQMDANVLQAERQPQEKSHWLQGPSTSPQVLKGFQEDPNVQDVKDLQEKKHLETPSRKGEGNQKLVGPGHLQFSQKQNEHQRDPEVLSLPKEISHDPQNIPELSDEKESEATHKGGIDGLQTTSRQQDIVECTETLRRMEEISQPWKPCGHQGEKDLEISQALVTPDMDQTLPEKKEGNTQEGSSQDGPFHGLNVNNPQREALRRSKSLGCLEVVTPWSMLFQGSSDPKTSLQLLPENLQRSQMGNVHSQPSPSSLQSETEVVQTDAEMVTTEPPISLQGKEEPQKEVDSQDGGNEKTFHTQGTQVPQPQDWEELDLVSNLQEGSPVLHVAEMKRSSEDVCHQEEKVLESSRHGPPLKKSNSPEPQELLRTKVNESGGSSKIPLERRYLQDPQHLEWEKVKSQKISEREVLKLPDTVEVLQHPNIPTCKEDVIEIPGLLPKISEAPKLKEMLDFQKQEAPSKEIQSSHPRAQNQMDPDPLPAQELQMDLSRSQGFRPRDEKEPEFQIGLARKGNSPQLDERSRLQDVGQSEELHISGALEGIDGEVLQPQKAQLDCPILTLSESLKLQPQKLDSESQGELSVTQDFRSLESPPLLWSILWQKAKSFEQMKPCLLLGPQLGQAAIQRMTKKEKPILQLPKETKGPLMVQREEGSVVEMEHQKLQKSNILDLQDLKQQEVMPQTQTEKVVLAEKCVQTEPQQFQQQGEVLLEITGGQVNLGEKRPGETGEMEIPSSHEAPQSKLQKLQREEISQRELELLEHSGSFLKEDLSGTQPSTIEVLEKIQIQENVLQKEIFVQEHRSPDSPPLLWGVMGLKSKSFELRTSCDIEAQEPKDSAMAPLWRRADVELESSTLQKCKGLDVTSSQDLQKVESPPDTSKMGTFQSGGILPAYPQESRSPKVNNSKIPPPEEAGPRTIISPSPSEREVLMGQEIREMGSSPIGTTSQEKPESSETSQVVELTKDPELEDQQQNLCKTKCLETRLHPEESRSFESSPLLERALGIRAKSFELTKSQAFRMSSSEATSPRSQQELQASHAEESSKLGKIPPSEELQMEPESQGTQMHGAPQVCHPTDLGDQVVTQIQVGKSVYTQTPDSVSMQRLLEESKEIQTLELQELRDLEVPQAQSDKILEELEKLGNVKPHGKNFGALTSQPAPERKAEYLQHPKRCSPETPPLLWWVLELAHYGMLYNVSPQPQEPSSYVPGTQRQEGPQSEPEAQHPRSQIVSLAEKLQKLEVPQPQKDSFQVEGSRRTDLQSQECKDAEPFQPHEIVAQVGTTSPGLSVSEASQDQEKAKSCQGPKRSPQDLEVHLLKEREPVSVEESSEGDVQSREGSSVTQKILIPMKPKDSECLVQEEMSKLCDSFKVIHLLDHQTLDTLGKGDSPDPSLSSAQFQKLKTDGEHHGLLSGSQVLHPKEPAYGELLKGVKQEDFPILDPSEEHSKINVDPPLEKALGKSKSFDLGELQILKKTQEAPSFQTQTTEVLKTQEDLPKKHQKKTDSQTISFQAKDHQDTPQPLQSHESASESPSVLQNSLTQSSEVLEMNPCSLNSPELQEVLQPQSSKLQRTTNSKMLCLQGHHEAENCELGVEDSHLEMQGILQRSPHSFLVQDTLYPLADTFRKSKSLELPKANIVLLQGLKRPDISPSQENVKEHPQILDHQTSSQVMNTSLQEKKSRCPPQKDSQSQQEPGQNKPATLNAEDDQTQQLQRQERMEVLPSPGVPQECVFLQIQENLQSNPEYFGCGHLAHPEVLQPEKRSATPETLKLEKHVESITQLSLVSTEKGGQSVWWPLGRSKSLDLREHQVPDLKSLLGELDCSKPWKMPSADLSQPQRNLLDEQWKCRAPLVDFKTQPLEVVISKAKIGQQEEKRCANQKTEHMDLEAQKSQELLTHENEIMTFQKLEDIQMSCSKEYRELEAPQLQVTSQSLKEPLCTDQHVQTDSKSQGLRKPPHHNHQEERNLQSPLLLRNLLRKSETFGYEELASRVDPQLQDVQREEEPGQRPSLHVERQLLWRFEGSKPQIIQEISKPEVLQHQEMANVESVGESTGQPNCPREAPKIEMESIKSKISLHANQEAPREQEDTQHIVPQDSVPHVVPPCDIPQFGITFLQELGRLHTELSTLRPSQELKHLKAICPRGAKDSSQPQQQIPAEPQINSGSQVPEHQKWSAASSPQPPRSPGDFSEASKMQQESLQSPQSQGPDQMSGVKRELVRNMGSPTQKAPQKVQRQEDLSKKSIMVSGIIDPPSLQSLENVEAKSLDLQEFLNLEGKVREKEPMVTEPEVDYPSNMQEPLLAKSKSLESLSRNQEFQHERTKMVGGLPSLDREMATECRPISQGALNVQAEAISAQSQGFPTKRDNGSILLVQNQKREMTQQADQHFQEKHERLKLQERRKLKSWKGQELESLQLQWTEENQAFPQWRKAGALLAEGTQPKNHSTREKGLLNLAEPEPGDGSRRLERFWEQRTTETTAMTLLSPSSPGKPSEMIWEPTTLNMDICRETSFDAVQLSLPSWEGSVHIRVTCPGDPPSLEKSTDPALRGEPHQKATSSFRGEGVDGQPLLPPHPPSREKAFIWLSPRDKKEALQRLAETQAQGERRHRRDKERQALRFQERLSIAKRRRSEEKLLGDDPADGWPWASPTSEGQDEAGQKMAVKTRLQKIKRERTYVLQSQRERNTLKFKQLLDPLVAPREEKPTQRKAGELQPRGAPCPSGSPGDRGKKEALPHRSRMVPKEE